MTDAQRIPSLLRAERLARVPLPPADPAAARLDQAILSIGALAARPQFHAESRDRAGLGRHHFPDHPARRVDPALYGVLAALVGEGMPGPTSIAIRLGLHPSTVAHHLERLERRGLVERRHYPGNRKWGQTLLTPAGKVAYETIRDARHEALRELLGKWTEEEQRQLVGQVARLGDAIRALNMAARSKASNRLREAEDRRSPEEKERARRLAAQRYRRYKAARGEERGRRRSPCRTVTVDAVDLW
jgi:DNA-binding MarR family transcriptional regulator